MGSPHDFSCANATVVSGASERSVASGSPLVFSGANAMVASGASDRSVARQMGSQHTDTANGTSAAHLGEHFDEEYNHNQQQQLEELEEHDRHQQDEPEPGPCCSTPGFSQKKDHGSDEGNTCPLDVEKLVEQLALAQAKLKPFLAGAYIETDEFCRLCQRKSDLERRLQAAREELLDKEDCDDL